MGGGHANGRATNWRVQLYSDNKRSRIRHFLEF